MQIQVVVPTGFEVRDAKDAGIANLFADILDSGSRSLDRQAFLDRLSMSGASASFTVSNQYSYWTLNFPFEKNRSYGELGATLAEQWASPRFTEESFGLAKLKLESALKSGLDSDGSLGLTTIRRLMNKRYFSGTPLTLDVLRGLKLSSLPAVWDRDYVNARDVFAAVVAPAEAEPAVRALLSAVFAKQGAIEVKREPSRLEARENSAKGHKAEKTFVIVDKPGRAQSYLSVVGVPNERLDADDEIAFQFGNHVLIDSGLGSVFGDEIRNQRGLAYAVQSAPRFYLGYPGLGVITNPVREKSAVALDLVAKLLNDAYVSGEILRQLPPDIWARQWKSFVYGRALDTSTPAGRQAERVAVATGTMGLKAYRAQLDGDRPIGRDEVIESLRRVWRKGAIVATVVGEAKELEPMVRKAFPDFGVRVIPYRETLNAKTYETP